MPEGGDAGVYNMVTEIPKYGLAKMEVDTKGESNPIVQDEKKGKLRFYHGPIFWNYGCIPQTWENPNEEHPELKCFGRRAGRELRGCLRDARRILRRPGYRRGGSRHRRGRHVDIPWTGGRRRDGSRHRRGRHVDIPRTRTSLRRLRGRDSTATARDVGISPRHPAAGPRPAPDGGAATRNSGPTERLVRAQATTTRSTSSRSARPRSRPAP